MPPFHHSAAKGADGIVNRSTIAAEARSSTPGPRRHPGREFEVGSVGIEYGRVER